MRKPKLGILRCDVQHVVLEDVGNGAYRLRPDGGIGVHEAVLGHPYHVAEVRRKFVREVREAFSQQFESRFFVQRVLILDQLDGAPGQLRPLVQLQARIAHVGDGVTGVAPDGVLGLSSEARQQRLFQHVLRFRRYRLPRILGRIPGLRQVEKQPEEDRRLQPEVLIGIGDHHIEREYEREVYVRPLERHDLGVSIIPCGSVGGRKRLQKGLETIRVQIHRHF
ncbi:fatty acid desaturase, putative [Babesia ovata]|uniref:Fatty acid desaturase, putative n=1 Tax=Babesia ovata TaxID=189622 RepID=A0A2H6K9U6_9APIC|nr:fatty acid desaturase, putative [Babesia ovata]GBE59763.1 fatty acid desaturase, putative [Babesia ovata]